MTCGPIHLKLPLMVLCLLATAPARASSADSLKAGADSLHKRAIEYLSAGTYDSARATFESEIKLRKTLPDTVGTANGLVALCQACELEGDLAGGLRAGEEALRMLTASGKETDTAAARCYHYLGNIYDDQSAYEKALAHYRKAYELRLNALGPGHPDVARSDANIGIIYMRRGDYPKAMEHYDTALATLLKILGPEDMVVASVINNQGNVHVYSGDYSKSLDCYTRALAIRLKILGAGHPDVALNYNNIAGVYYYLGDYRQALENYSKALAIISGILGPENPLAASQYNNIGNVHEELGEYPKALEYYGKSLAICLKALGPDHPDAADCYHNIGNIWFDRDDYSKALDFYNKALAIRLKLLGASHPSVAISYTGMGSMSQWLGDRQQALVYFNKALAIYLKVFGPDHPDVADCYYNLGTLFRDEGKMAEALDFLTKAVAVTEKTRAGVQSEELRKTYSESKRNVYDEIITLLLELGRPKEAFEYYERSKSKLLQDELMKKGIELGQGETKQKLGDARSLALQVSALEKQVVEEKTKPAPEQNRLKLANLTGLLAETKSRLDGLVQEIKLNPDYSFAVSVDPFQFSSIQQDLPDGALFVMYYSSAERLSILTVSRKGFAAKSVGVSKDSLDRLVKQYRQGLEEAGSGSAAGLHAVVAALYGCLIAPVRDQVAACREVTFIPAGNLYYIPLGALGCEQNGVFRCLLEDKPVSYLTSAELYRYAERKAKPATDNYNLLVVGNPAGAELPSAAEEAQEIHILYPASKLYLDADARKPTVAGEAAACRLLHLATHAYANPQNPWDSYVYLVKGDTGTGRWTMAEVTGQAWDKMSLVTLSACETAVGGDKPGLEMESIARAFMIAGSPTIVASLCPVSDESTKELMVGFYTNLKSMSKVEALRQAQLSVMRNKAYTHPFFWAPFILIGDGR